MTSRFQKAGVSTSDCEEARCKMAPQGQRIATLRHLALEPAPSPLHAHPARADICRVVNAPAAGATGL
eukprot:548576-Alexandrium_andersonii.AAC.1